MPIVAAATIGSALIGASASKSAAKASANAADRSAALQKEIYDDTSAKFAPYLTAGNNALGAYNYEMGLGDKPTDYAGFTASPSYQFQLDQGNASVNALAGSRGGLNSGATMKALADYNQGLASQEYGNYMNRLSGLVNTGTSAAANQATAGQNYATNAGNAYMAAGQAQSQGYLNQANAVTGAINNGLGTWMYQNALAKGA